MVPGPGWSGPGRNGPVSIGQPRVRIGQIRVTTGQVAPGRVLISQMLGLVTRLQMMGLVTRLHGETFVFTQTTTLVTRAADDRARSRSRRSADAEVHVQLVEHRLDRVGEADRVPGVDAGIEQADDLVVGIDNNGAGVAVVAHHRAVRRVDFQADLVLQRVRAKPVAVVDRDGLFDRGDGA